MNLVSSSEMDKLRALQGEVSQTEKKKKQITYTNANIWNPEKWY